MASVFEFSVCSLFACLLVLGKFSNPIRNTVQYSTVQYCTVHYSTVQYSIVQYSIVQYCYCLQGQTLHYKDREVTLEVRVVTSSVWMGQPRTQTSVRGLVGSLF